MFGLTITENLTYVFIAQPIVYFSEVIQIIRLLIVKLTVRKMPFFAKVDVL